MTIHVYISAAPDVTKEWLQEFTEKFQNQQGIALYVPELMGYPEERIRLGWIRKCDAMLVVPGHEKGSEIELETARRYRVPVFYEPYDLIKGTFELEKPKRYE